MAHGMQTRRAQRFQELQVHAWSAMHERRSSLETFPAEPDASREHEIGVDWRWADCDIREARLPVHSPGGKVPDVSAGLGLQWACKGTLSATNDCGGPQAPRLQRLRGSLLSFQACKSLGSNRLLEVAHSRFFAYPNIIQNVSEIIFVGRCPS